MENGGVFAKTQSQFFNSSIFVETPGKSESVIVSMCRMEQFPWKKIHEFKYKASETLHKNNVNPSTSEWVLFYEAVSNLQLL